MTRLKGLHVRISMTAEYFKMARGNAEEYLRVDEEIVKTVFEQDYEQDQLIELYHMRQRTGVSAITFSMMGIEAFLFDYAAEKLGDNYVKENLDKLEVKNKYIVYPHVAYQKKMDKGKHVYEKLRHLVALRNELVHSKSKSYEMNDVQEITYHFDKFNNDLRNGVPNAIECVRLIMNEFDNMHPEMNGKFKAYLEDE